VRDPPGFWGVIPPDLFGQPSSGAQSGDEELDQVARVVVRVAARPGAQVPDTAEQFVGILAGTDLTRRGGCLEELPGHGDQAAGEVGVQRLEGRVVGP
jgi:hypothetical protein